MYNVRLLNPFNRTNFSMIVAAVMCFLENIPKVNNQGRVAQRQRQQAEWQKT